MDHDDGTPGGIGQPPSGHPDQRDQPEPRYEPSQSPYPPPYAQQPPYPPPPYAQQPPPYTQQPRPEYPPATGYGQPAYPQPGYPQAYERPPYQQPAYQQPGYEQQPGFPGQYVPGAGGPSDSPPPPRRSRAGWWIAVAVVVVIGVSALLAFVTPGFLVRKTFSARSIASTIENQSKGRGDYRNVTCPSGEKVTKGATFSCSADGGKKITITVTSGSGDYTWEPVG